MPSRRSTSLESLTRRLAMVTSILPQPWRMLGPVEGLTGILMCGLSTGLFFAIIARLIGPRFKAEIH